MADFDRSRPIVWDTAKLDLPVLKACVDRALS